MSRFFNETRKALQQERKASNGSGTFSVDLQEAINELKSGMENEIHPAAGTNPPQVIPILSGRQKSARRLRLPAWSCAGEFASPGGRKGCFLRHNTTGRCRPL